jgi:hypothetical protein
MSEPNQHVYSIQVSESGSFLLRDVERTKFHGIDCLTGIDDRPGSWMSRRQIYVPLTTIRGVVEFESMEQYETAVKEWREMKSKQSKQ